MVRSVPMIAMTTSSSNRVKPRWCRIDLPLMVGQSVQAGLGRLRIDIVDIVAGLRIIRRAGVRSQPPGIRSRRLGVWFFWFVRNTTQKVDFDALLGTARIVYTVHQCLQIRRVAAGFVGTGLDTAGIGGLFVIIDRIALCTQGIAQLGLTLALIHQVRRRQHCGRKQGNDTDGDHELNQSEPRVLWSLPPLWVIASCNGVAGVAAMAAPSAPTSTTWVAIWLWRAATARKRRVTMEPFSPTDAPDWAANSSCTPPGFNSTFGSAPAGARSPGSALTNCTAVASNRTCARTRPGAVSEASRTTTSNS